jgi:hypothetical protein
LRVYYGLDFSFEQVEQSLKVSGTTVCSIFFTKIALYLLGLKALNYHFEKYAYELGRIVFIFLVTHLLQHSAALIPVK